MSETTLPSADGSAHGYSARATLTFATEFRRQLTRRRTQVTLGFMVLLPIVLYLAFSLGGNGDDPDDDSGNAFALADFGTVSAANFTLFALLVSSGFLLVVVAALFCGDSVAGEAGWGSLRYLLATPVPRGRLLAVKFAVGLSFVGLAMVILTGSCLLVGTLAYGWQPLQAPLGGEVAANDALWRVLGVAGYLSILLLSVSALALLLSVSTDAPLAAVGGAVVLQIVSNILNAVQELGELRTVLPTRYTQAWLSLLSSPVQWDEMVRGTVTSLVYATIFGVWAFWKFSRKDVTS